MARFPRTEPEILALAQAMEAGFLANIATYPAPPVMPVDLNILETAYLTAKNDAIAAAAAAEAATAAKDEALANLTEAMVEDIRYAEHTAKNNDDKLKLIGWAGKAAATPLALPGQVRNLEVTKQGAGWLMLDWKAPADGGKPATYTIMRRERPEGAWAIAGVAMTTEATLVEQPTGKELEYRIVAANKTGDGEASNTEMVVL